jgi:hypothetical protein
MTKLKIKKQADYYEKVTYGAYDGHEFRIHDTNGLVYVQFLDGYLEKEVDEFNEIVSEIKKHYFKSNHQAK